MQKLIQTGRYDSLNIQIFMLEDFWSIPAVIIRCYVQGEVVILGQVGKISPSGSIFIEKLRSSFQ
jgi:hypothetical protein